MIKLSNISKIYHNQGKNIHALKNVNVELPDKGMVCLLGKSGCGKTTLLNIIGTLDYPSSGSFYFDSTNVLNLNNNDLSDFRANCIAIIFQENHLFPTESVEGNLAYLNELYPDINENLAKKILDEVELNGKEKNLVNELSGGQKQRVNIVRSLLKESKILIADEPTGNLDEKTELIIFRLLKKISQNKLVLLVTHNRNLANTYSDRIIELKDGEILFDITTNKDTNYEEIKIDGNKVTVPTDNNFTLDDWIIIKKLLLEIGNVNLSTRSTEKKEKGINLHQNDISNNSMKRSSISANLTSYYLKNNLLNHLFTVIVLSVIGGIILTVLNISNFNESYLLYDTLIKNEIRDVRFSSEEYLYASGYSTKLDIDDYSILTDEEFTPLFNFGFEFDRLDSELTSVLYQFDMYGLAGYNSEPEVLYEANIIQDNGIYLTDYTMMILLYSNMYSDVEQIVGETLMFHGIPIYVNGVIDTDYEKYDSLKNYTFSSNNVTSDIQKLYDLFEEDRYNLYSRLYINTNHINTDEVTVIIGDWDFRLNILTENIVNEQSIIYLNDSEGLIISEELFNMYFDESEANQYLKIGDNAYIIRGYSSELDMFTARTTKELLDSIKLESSKPDELLLKSINETYIRELMDGGLTHNSFVSETVKDISFVFSFIKDIMIISVGVLVMLFLIIYGNHLQNNIKSKNLKTGILLSLGTKRKDFYVSNLLENIVVITLIFIISIILCNSIGIAINSNITNQYNILIQTLNNSYIFYIVYLLGIYVSAFSFVIRATKIQLNKTIVALIK